MMLDDLKQIEGLLKDQNKSADEQYEEMRQGILTAKKKKREEDLEGKDKKPGGGGLKDKMLDAITKPAGNFFNKIIKFITFTFLGSVVNNLLAIIKDPSRLLDPIRKFFNVLIGMFNAMSKMMWKITGAPMNGIIEGINNGVKDIIESVNSVTQKLNLPPLTWDGIPLIPGPPEVPMIPLSETGQAGQAKNEGAVAMAGGGVVPEMSMGQQIMKQTDYNEDGSISLSQATVEERHALFKKMGLPSMELWDGSVVPDFGKMGEDSFMKGMQLTRSIMVENEADPVRIKFLDDFMATNPYAQSGKIQEMINRVVPGSTEQVLGDLGDDISAKAKMSGGGFVPYSNFTLGTGHNVIDTAPGNIMGYNKGGKVPGSGNGDTVPAMLTPGEFVMSKGAVNMIGADKLMAMNKAGGGTNQPKMMKFAGGGIVPGIDAPSGKNRKVVVIGGGGGAQAPSQVASSGDSGDGSRRFSSTDPNNMTISVIKSLYNMMG